MNPRRRLMFKMRDRARRAQVTTETATQAVEPEKVVVSAPTVEVADTAEEVVEEAPAVEAPKKPRVSRSPTKKTKSKKL